MMIKIIQALIISVPFVIIGEVFNYVASLVVLSIFLLNIIFTLRKDFRDWIIKKENEEERNITISVHVGINELLEHKNFNLWCESYMKVWNVKKNNNGGY